MNNLLQQFPKKHILFLKGCKIQKSEEEDPYMNEFIKENIRYNNMESEQITLTKKMPIEFTTIDEWSKHTDIYCWNCNFSFKDVPVFIPTRYDQNKLVNGNENCFCSFPCASKYIEDTTHDKSEMWQSKKFLCILYQKFTGNKLDYIPSGLHKKYLQIFGGELTIEEYRKRNKDILQKQLRV